VDLVFDIRSGLPLADDALDDAVSVHAVQEVPYPEVVPVLRELRRVLRPGGILRLCLPDLDRDIRAYLQQDRSYFLLPDDEVRSLGGKFIAQALWLGYTRTGATPRSRWLAHATRA
jgi:SAM-dependent methyltransferase